MVRFAMRGVRMVTLVLAAYWLLLFIGTHIPRGNMPNLHHSDKLLHFAAYAGLAFLLAWAFPKEAARPNAHVWGALLVAMIYGASDEISQIPVGRTADIMDWIADSLGAASGLFVYLVFRPMWNFLQRRRANMTELSQERIALARSAK